MHPHQETENHKEKPLVFPVTANDSQRRLLAALATVTSLLNLALAPAIHLTR